jgi:hypothetical protein
MCLQIPDQRMPAPNSADILARCCTLVEETLTFAARVPNRGRR